MGKKSFPARLHQFRVDQNLSVYQLSIHVGIHDLRLYEQGKTDPLVISVYGSFCIVFTVQLRRPYRGKVSGRRIDKMIALSAFRLGELFVIYMVISRRWSLELLNESPILLLACAA